MIKYVEINKVILDRVSLASDLVKDIMEESGLPIIRHSDNDGNIEYSTDTEVKIIWCANGNLRFTWIGEYKGMDQL